MNLDGYYLDLHKLDQMKDATFRDRIHDMYRDMIFSYEEKRNLVANSFFLTLFHSGYLIDVRNEKIEELLNDNSISS